MPSCATRSWGSGTSAAWSTRRAMSDVPDPTAPTDTRRPRSSARVVGPPSRRATTWR